MGYPKIATEHVFYEDLQEQPKTVLRDSDKKGPSLLTQAGVGLVHATYIELRGKG